MKITHIGHRKINMFSLKIKIGNMFISKEHLKTFQKMYDSKI